MTAKKNNNDTLDASQTSRAERGRRAIQVFRGRATTLVAVEIRVD